MPGKLSAPRDWGAESDKLGMCRFRHVRDWHCHTVLAATDGARVRYLDNKNQMRFGGVMRPRHAVLFALASVVLVATSVSPLSGQTYSVLYNFGTVSTDPYNPVYTGAIAQGRDGNLYTTASAGGGYDVGAVFSMSTSGTMTLVHSFSGTDGSCPFGGLTLGTDGNFYGTTFSGGTYGVGTVFMMTPSGTITTLYNFTGGTDGYYPYAPPIQATDGNWYGTTTGGGSIGGGTVYKLTSAGVFTTLYSFDGTTHGGQPRDPLVQGTDGNLYGTTIYGGQNSIGTVFKITTAGKLTVLYSFASEGYPDSPLIQGTDGNLYGTVEAYGAFGGGAAFKITTTGKYTLLHSMNPSTDGETPFAGLIQASNGVLYGANGTSSNTSYGTLFSLTTAGVFTVVHSFDGTTGSAPQVSLIQHTNGTLYGDTYEGGTGSLAPCPGGQCGVFYSLNASLPAFAGLVSTSGKVGAKVGILGQNFSSSSVVKFGAAQATTITLTGTTFIKATVPSGATTANVTVTTSGTTLTSNKQFRVTPQITSFTPSSGVQGSSVTITGVSLTQTSKVTFGGVAAKTFTVNSDTQVTATVPSGAKTGKIVITTSGGTATSSGTFTVQPAITSFTPTSGPVGTSVTITGSGFTGATAVSFNAVIASFTFNSDSQITATVPSGATTGPIKVTTSGGSATSTTNFTVN